MIDTRTPEKIHLEIEEKLKSGVTYLDALVEYANEHELEVETVGEIIKKSKILKEKVRTEAAERRLLKNNGDIERGFFD